MKKTLINPKEIVKIKVNDEYASERFEYISMTIGFLWWKKIKSGYYDNYPDDWRNIGFATESEILSSRGGTYRIDDENKKVIVKSDIEIFDTNGNSTIKRFESERERDIFIEENFSKLKFIEILW